MTQPAISARELTKRYGQFTAVDNLNLDIYQGEVFGLLGPNGAGKTTTILMTLGLSEPTSGTVTVQGLDPARSPLEVKRQVGYLPDNVGFYNDLTGTENLNYTARLNGLAELGVADILAQVGLSNAADQNVGTYSRGMRQRLGIADALIKNPSIIVLDEPTIALDPQAVTEILDLIRDLPKQRGVAVLLSSHLLHQVESVCDRVAIFVDGRIIALGTVAELAAAQSGSAFAIEIEVDGEAESILRAVPSVTDVTTREGRYVVSADIDVTHALVAGLVAAGLTPTHVAKHRAGLDEIYREYFRERGESVGSRS